jgi:hypothetical protein
MSETSDTIAYENFYKEHFPIKEVFYQGVNYLNKTLTVADQTFKYQAVNKNKQTISDYIDY